MKRVLNKTTLSEKIIALYPTLVCFPLNVKILDSAHWFKTTDPVQNNIKHWKEQSVCKSVAYLVYKSSQNHLQEHGEKQQKKLLLNGFPVKS